MTFAAGFSWFHLIPSLSDTALLGIHQDHVTYLIVTTWSVCAFLVGLAVLARLQLNAAMSRNGVEKYFADDRLTIRNAFEIVTGSWFSSLKSLMTEKDARFFLPFIVSIFLYIFVNNIIGAFPGFLPATESVNTNLGMAVIVFSTFVGFGLFRDPVGFVKHMGANLGGYMLPIGVIVACFETIGFLIRPMTLTIRLAANMFADHLLLGTFSGLVPLVVPSLLMGLGMFVSFMQAFVFSLLTSLYISFALPHHEHGDHADHH